MPTSKSAYKKPSLQSFRGYDGYCRALEANQFSSSLINNLRSKFALYKAKKLLKAQVKENPPVLDVERQALLKELFPSGFKNIKIIQSNIGDCHLIASKQALMDITCSKFSHEKYFSSIIRKLEDGSFKVTFPKYKEFPIIVTKEEAKSGKITLMDDKERHFIPVIADPGFQIIERAFGRLRKQLAMFFALSKIPKDKMDDTFIALENCGLGNETIEILTGWEPIFIKNKFRMRKFLDKFAQNPDKYIATAATVCEQQAPTIFYAKLTETGEKIVYMDKCRNLLVNHAYSIKSINQNKKEIVILNPHDDTAKDIIISYGDFLKYFNHIAGVKIPKKSAFFN